MVVLPEPVTARFLFAAVIPARVRLAPSFSIVVLPVRVIVPDQVLALARLSKAPVAPTPVPVRLKGLARANPVPSRSIAALAATEVAPTPPRAAELWTSTIPALTVVLPL